MDKRLKAVTMAQSILTEKVKIADFLLDATTGNGFDTLFLAKNSKKTAEIWAFDVQQQAVSAARQMLEGKGCADKVHFILDSHTNILCYIPNMIDVAMFNLGYLPKADRSIKTLPAATMAAIEQACAILAPGGLISVVTYPGHETGKDEHDVVTAFLKNLPAKDFSAGCWTMLNRANCPPVLYIVEKKTKK